jgi:enolase-phosphatase E1
LGKAEEKVSKVHSNEEWIAGQVNLLMDSDSKSTGLKALQGLIWRSGFEGGELTSHLFHDVVPAIENWQRQAIAVGIYSSGSIVAQRLFFGHTPDGDLTSFFVRHYDTTIGSKRAAASYHRIAADFGYHPSEILFLSDVFEELEAASAAGFQAVAVERPGNAPLPEVYRGARITSFSQLDLTNESMT